MAKPGERRDGYTVRTVQGETRRSVALYQALALFLVACSAGYLLMPADDTPRRTPPPAQSAADAAPAAASADVPRRIVRAKPAAQVGDSGRLADPKPSPEQVARAAEGKEDPTLDLRAYIPPGETPTGAQLIEELHKRGIYEGIGAFDPPGTSPPMVGLAVPEDFELPEGYVRHYQATDDGQRIEPILMFSDDYDFVDENGNPIRVPDDGVVPPELAPPGLPIRPIVIPPDRQ